MNPKITSEFQKMLDVNTPIIYINDYDFARIDEYIAWVVGANAIKKGNVKEWNPATGVTNFVTKNPLGDGRAKSIEQFLYESYTFDSELPVDKYVVLKEIQDYIDSPEVKTFLSLIAQRKLYDRSFETTVVIVSSVLKVPQEIAQYVSFLDVDLPQDEEINDLIDWHIKVNNYDEKKFLDKDREKLLPSLKGMTSYEIDRMLDMAMSSNGSLSAEDKEMILKQKKRMVKNSGVLELVDSPEKMDSIGGVEVLKEYLVKKANIFQKLSEAQKFGVSIPKGVFLVGMPGCGKSLCAKATAAAFDAPLLKMDMGSMMGMYQGQSEENLRKAIKIAEAAAPCVLWIDEIEKAFAGVGGGSGNSDSLMRMFGYFLSWLQDKNSSVYVIATANNAENLPPELKRRGRFDEIFCVKLPTPEEREAIFKVHIDKKSKYSCTFSDIDYKLLASDKVTKGFNGADIESVVNDAVEECFLEEKDITTECLKNIALKTKSISKTCKKQIEEMDKMFKGDNGESGFTNASL